MKTCVEHGTFSIRLANSLAEIKKSDVQVNSAMLKANSAGKIWSFLISVGASKSVGISALLGLNFIHDSAKVEIIEVIFKIKYIIQSK